MKRIFLFGAIITMLLSIFTPSVTHASDDNAGHVFENEYEVPYSKFMNGYGNGVYLPSENVTQAAFTPLLVRASDISQKDAPQTFTYLK